MTIFNPYPVRITDKTGRPIAYALAYFYAAGTTTMVEVFSDAALSIPRTNPVLSGGAENPGLLPEIFVNDANALRVVYADADGVTIYDADDIEPSAPARTPIDDVSGAARAYAIPDIGRIIRRDHSGAMADTLPAAASAGNGAYLTIWNVSDFSLTLSVSGGGTIDGAASLVLRAGQRVTVVSDGVEWSALVQAVGFGGHMQSLPAAFFEARPTNPATYNLKALAGSNKTIREWVFSNVTEQGVCGRFTVPVSWDGLPIEAQVKWNSSAGLGSTVRFGIRGRVLGNAEDIDQAYGALATIDDASNGAASGEGCEMQSDWLTFTPASLGGTNGGKTLELELVRPLFGTLAGDIAVTDVVLRLNVNKGNDN